jgi:para-nitrobenzyl esterase
VTVKPPVFVIPAYAGTQIDGKNLEGNIQRSKERKMNSQNYPEVETKSGKIEGLLVNGLSVFRGIPYAEPPIQDLRWMPPQPVKPWSGVRSAKEFGPIAPQNAMQGGFTMQTPQPQSEDCLFLNVLTPGLDNAKRPVMVWIHGGAFTMGSGSDSMYDSDTLLKRGNIVMVTINYRLGLLGFLRLKDATGNAIPATGNEGLLDQVLALKWVKDNIAAFGGDPDNVTLFGESAGSMSIACLMVMPAAKGLFQKGILESGVGSVSVPREEANRVGELFLNFSGIRKDNIKALKSLTPAQLLEIEMKIRMASIGTGGTPRVTSSYPIVDGEVIPDYPNKLAGKGASKDILSIIGTNLDEYTLFGMMDPGMITLTESDLKQRLTAMLPGSGTDELVEIYSKALHKRSEPVNPANILTAITTDLMFRMPALDLVEAQQKNNTPVYSYIFTWKSPVMGGVLKACHALEIGFVFGKYDDMFCGTGPEADKLSECMQEAWIAFAHTGNPSSKCTGEWPVYGENRLTMVLDKENHVKAAPFEAEREVWENVKRGDYFII